MFIKTTTLLHISMQLMIAPSPDDQSEVSLTTSLQPAAETIAEQSLLVFTVTVAVLNLLSRWLTNDHCMLQ